MINRTILIGPITKIINPIRSHNVAQVEQSNPNLVRIRIGLVQKGIGGELVLLTSLRLFYYI